MVTSHNEKRLSVSKLAATTSHSTGKSWKPFRKPKQKPVSYLYLLFPLTFRRPKKRNIAPVWLQSVALVECWRLGQNLPDLSHGGVSCFAAGTSSKVGLQDVPHLAQQGPTSTTCFCKMQVPKYLPNGLKHLELFRLYIQEVDVLILFDLFCSVKPQTAAVVSWLPPLPPPSVAV